MDVVAQTFRQEDQDYIAADSTGAGGKRKARDDAAGAVLAAPVTTVLATPTVISLSDSVLHQLHIVQACEKRLRDCDEAEENNVYPENPNHAEVVYAQPSSTPTRADWEADPRAMARYIFKKTVIKDKRAEAKYKRDRALAKLRTRTHPNLLKDSIFDPLDVEAEWSNLKPPAVVRQKHQTVADMTRPSWMDPADWPDSTMDEPGPPAPARPPASDKVELMQRWLVEHQSEQPPPPPSGPVFPPVGQLQRVPGQRTEEDTGEGPGYSAGIEDPDEEHPPFTQWGSDY